MNAIDMKKKYELVNKFGVVFQKLGQMYETCMPAC